MVSKLVDDAAQANGASASVQSKSFTTRNKPIHSNRHLRVICIGAGISGLYMAYKLKHYFTDFSLDIYEKNPDIGGTWYENRYPGCACDVPAHNYTYSFEPKLDWSATYVSSSEIFTYLADFAGKYGLRQYISCDHEVIGAFWDESEWVVTVCNRKDLTVFEKRCDFLINASGVLNKWKWPAIPGLQSYRGKLLHSAAWDDSVDLGGKNVGIIGNGSSALQILPQVQKVASHVTAFIRQRGWISPILGTEHHVYTDEQKRQFRNEPDTLLEVRRATESELNRIFPTFLKESVRQKMAVTAATKDMKSRLKPELAEKLIPDFPLGCRRLTPGMDYLETLGLDNVSAIFGDITEITSKGCVTNNGVETAVDVLVCATGFDTTFRPRFPVVGRRKDVDLAREWESEPRSYLAVAAHGYPNYFMFLGPNSAIANGPIIFGIELQGEYILRFLNRWQKEDIRAFDPKKEAVDDFMQHKEAFMPSTVWADGGCRSWYKDNRSGKVTAVWPGSSLHYMEALSEVRWDDFDVTYNGNRFAYLGNGTSQMELDPNADLAYYIKDKDDGATLSRSAIRTLTLKESTPLTA